MPRLPNNVEPSHFRRGEYIAYDPRVLALAEVIRTMRPDNAHAHAHVYVYAHAIAHAIAHTFTDEDKAQIDAAHALLFK